ncbi:MAG: DNA polymerase [Nevskiaceae bacterium]|nr:MAG: DNA polymerase [Nevskiaceae bacterium]
MRLAVDFNSYFASVEQQLDPKLRGRPVAVVPSLADTTSCIAASYQAKRFGVKTGTLVREARQLCPQLVLVVGDHSRYVEYHHRLWRAIDSVLPIWWTPSIDEMHCELNRRDQTVPRAVAYAQRIKQTIREQVGECLTCSIGIAPNAYLAKTASDMQKPDGLVVIEKKDLPQILHPLELRDFCGIGPNMERRLRAHGIDTAAQLCAASREELRRAWGSVEGELMWARLRGEEVHTAPAEQRSIGHSHVLPPAERNDADAHAVIHRMLQKAAMRLRKSHLVAGAMHVRISYAHRENWSRDGRFGETQDTLALGHCLDALWAQRPRGKGAPAPFAVGVTLLDLRPEQQQTLPLFETDRPHGRLDTAMDRLNLRYGKSTVYFGRAHTARNSAPMRIAFTRIPDLDTER